VTWEEKVWSWWKEGQRLILAGLEGAGNQLLGSASNEF